MTSEHPYLTPQETRVARLVFCGLRNDEIAARLVVEETTVRQCMFHLYWKFGLRGMRRRIALKRAKLVLRLFWEPIIG